MPGLICSNCHKRIPPATHPYTMKIELYPRVEESLQISEAEFQMDLAEEMEKVIEQLEAMTPEEVHEEEARVYTSFSFVLCPACRDHMARQLQHGESFS